MTFMYWQVIEQCQEFACFIHTYTICIKVEMTKKNISTVCAPAGHIGPSLLSVILPLSPFFSLSHLTLLPLYSRVIRCRGVKGAPFSLKNGIFKRGRVLSSGQNLSSKSLLSTPPPPSWGRGAYKGKCLEDKVFP